MSLIDMPSASPLIDRLTVFPSTSATHAFALAVLLILLSTPAISDTVQQEAYRQPSPLNRRQGSFLLSMRAILTFEAVVGHIVYLPGQRKRVAALYSIVTTIKLTD